MRSTIDEAYLNDYLTGMFEGVKPVDSPWGDTFFYYNPDFFTQPDSAPADEIYFATLKRNDDEYDRASNLDRPSVFRLNMAISRASFRALFGDLRLPSWRERDQAAEPAAPDLAIDYAALDQLLPHPVYGRMYWDCVLNPSEDTFQEVARPLLDAAYQLAVEQYAKAAGLR